MLLSALQSHAGVGQDMRGVFVEPAEPLVLDVHFLCERLSGHTRQLRTSLISVNCEIHAVHPCLYMSQAGLVKNCHLARIHVKAQTNLFFF